MTAWGYRGRSPRSEGGGEGGPTADENPRWGGAGQNGFPDSTYIFVGPTLAAEEGARILDAVFLPPAAQGDVYRAVRRGASAIGVIDGYFERVPAVWHKELLYALARGVPVYGSASMGALRAAELAPFGMRGVGVIFEWFRDGALEDDDEVAVAHGPADTGFRSISEAMVNIRATCARAVHAGIVRPSLAQALIGIAKSLFYPERAYPTILRRAREAGATPREVQAVRDWLPRGRVDQKRADALAMLRAMGRPAGQHPATPHAGFYFEETEFWQIAAAEAEQCSASAIGAQPERRPAMAEERTDCITETDMHTIQVWVRSRAGEERMDRVTETDAHSLMDKLQAFKAGEGTSRWRQADEFRREL